MAINKISGNILSDNLVRGSALAFQTDLLYIDVINGNVGINTASATHTLTVNGNCNIVGPFQANDIYSGNSISATGNVTANVGSFTDLVVGNIDIGNLIGGGNLTVDSVTANLFLSSVGNVTGANIIATDTVFGNTISTTGNVEAANINGTTISSTGSVVGSIIEATTAITTIGNVTGGNLITDGYACVTGNVSAGNITTVGMISAAGNVSGGNITTPGDISAAGNITANNFSGIGNISLGNLTISNTTISTTLGTGNITLQPTGTALVNIDTVTGMVLPVGNTLQRPSPASTGTLRYNTDTTRMELYDGAEWDSVVSDVTNQTLIGNGTQTIFALDQASTTAAVLVIINGIVQLPTTAYSITGNTLTFTQAPAPSDTIDIRFL